MQVAVELHVPGQCLGINPRVGTQRGRDGVVEELLVAEVVDELLGVGPFGVVVAQVSLLEALQGRLVAGLNISAQAANARPCAVMPRAMRQTNSSESYSSRRASPKPS